MVHQPVSTTPAAIFPLLPLVSLILAANNENNISMLTLGSELKKKENSATQRCPNKIFKTFLIADFFHLPLVSLTPVVHLKLRILTRIFKKIQTYLMGYSGA